MVEQYEKCECIGRGSFGEVYKGVEKSTGRTVALKLVDLEKADDEIDVIQREIKVMSQIANPHVVQYYTSLMRGSTLWIVMEYMSGGSLKQLLDDVGPFPEDAIAAVLRALFQGLDYVHKERKVHRDVKAANILLSDRGDVKLADFGVAGQMTATVRQRNTFVGSPFWMAPEVIQESLYDEKADIWSAGITALELANGLPPYATEHPYQALFLIPKNPPPRLEGPQFSKPFKDFVASCLRKTPTDRLSAQQLVSHPFLRKGRPAAIRELLRKQKGNFSSGDHVDTSTSIEQLSVQQPSPSPIQHQNQNQQSLTQPQQSSHVEQQKQRNQQSSISALDSIEIRSPNGSIDSGIRSVAVPAKWDFDSVEERDRNVQSLDLGTFSKIPDEPTDRSSARGFDRNNSFQSGTEASTSSTAASAVLSTTNTTTTTGIRGGRGRSKSMPMPSATTTRSSVRDGEDDDIIEYEEEQMSRHYNDDDDDDDDGTGTVRRRADSFDLGSGTKEKLGETQKQNWKNSSNGKASETGSSEVLTQLILPVISQMRADVDASGDPNVELINSLGSLEVVYLECETAKAGSSALLMELLIKAAMNCPSKQVKDMMKRCLQSSKSSHQWDSG